MGSLVITGDDGTRDRVDRGDKGGVGDAMGWDGVENAGRLWLRRFGGESGEMVTQK